MSSATTSNNTHILNDEKVAQYLQANPDFFQHHENLLEALSVPHTNTGIATSLIERQVRLLRNQKNELDNQLKNLIQAARNNEQIINRMQRFTLDIIHAHSIEDIIILCQEEMHNNFNADYVGIKLIRHNDTDNASSTGNTNSNKNTAATINDAIFVSRDNALLQSFKSLFKNRKPICGRITHKQQQLMFPDHAENIRSAVLAPLQNTENIGIIALGSNDELRFQAGMGTLFISHLAEIITASLNRHLKTNQ